MIQATSVEILGGVEDRHDRGVPRRVRQREYTNKQECHDEQAKREILKDEKMIKTNKKPACEDPHYKAGSDKGIHSWRY